jgi:hypothetical protein
MINRRFNRYGLTHEFLQAVPVAFINRIALHRSQDETFQGRYARITSPGSNGVTEAWEKIASGNSWRKYPG